MKRLKKFKSYILYALLITVLFSCKNEPEQNSKKLETYLSKGEYRNIEIVKVSLVQTVQPPFLIFAVISMYYFCFTN